MRNHITRYSDKLVLTWLVMVEFSWPIPLWRPSSADVSTCPYQCQSSLFLCMQIRPHPHPLPPPKKTTTKQKNTNDKQTNKQTNKQKHSPVGNLIGWAQVGSPDRGSRSRKKPQMDAQRVVQTSQITRLTRCLESLRTWYWRNCGQRGREISQGQTGFTLLIGTRSEREGVLTGANGIHPTDRYRSRPDSSSSPKLPKTRLLLSLLWELRASLADTHLVELVEGAILDQEVDHQFMQVMLHG